MILAASLRSLKASICLRRDCDLSDRYSLYLSSTFILEALSSLSAAASPCLRPSSMAFIKSSSRVLTSAVLPSLSALSSASIFSSLSSVMRSISLSSLLASATSLLASACELLPRFLSAPQASANAASSNSASAAPRRPFLSRIFFQASFRYQNLLRRLLPRIGFGYWPVLPLLSRFRLTTEDTEEHRGFKSYFVCSLFRCVLCDEISLRFSPA